MRELKALGHDLWSLDPDQRWGPDYVTRRPGAGLMLTRHSSDEDDDSSEAGGEETVEVEFRPRA